MSRNTRRTPWNQRLAPYLFIVPNLAVFGLFTIWPAVNGFNISFYDSNNGRTFTPAGTDNYTQLLTNDEFRRVALNTVLFVVAFVVLATVCSVALAVLLDAQRRGRSFFRAVYFLPVLLSPVVVGLIWGWALDRKVGAVNGLLGAVGLSQPGWLVDSNLAMAVTIFVGIWTHIGFYGLIVLAGLQGIDRNLYEAARIDGASTWDQFRLVTLPLLRPTTLVIVILATIHGFQAFDYIYTLTGGGPVGATTLIVQFIYESAFESPIQYGLAAAGGVILFVVVFFVTALNYLVGRRRDAI